eukprot:m.52458 g.52458  ORF g.52458 m.52458 type:complete len:61 (-) comp21610_c1_seq1:80-262(-)
MVWWRISKKNLTYFKQTVTSTALTWIVTLGIFPWEHDHASSKLYGARHKLPTNELCVLVQ